MLKLQCTKTFQMISRCAALGPKDPMFKISSLLIVGGVLAKDQTVAGKPINAADPTQLSENDFLTLQKVILELMKMGVHLDNPEINLSNALYNDDFVDEPTPNIDLIILSWVNKDNPDDPTGYFSSPALKLGKTWEGALDTANPLLIAINGRPEFDCVSEQDIPSQYMKIATIERGFSLHQGPN